MTARVAAVWMVAGGVFGLASGLRAIRKNRPAVLWFALGFVSGPIALVAVLVQRRREEPAFL